MDAVLIAQAVVLWLLVGRLFLRQQGVEAAVGDALSTLNEMLKHEALTRMQADAALDQQLRKGPPA